MSFLLCCVDECTSRSGQGVPLHLFPNPAKDLRRFRTWVQNIQSGLTLLDDIFIFKNRRVCHRHLEVRFQYTMGKLSKLAEPTLYVPGASSVQENIPSMAIDNGSDSVQPQNSSPQNISEMSSVQGIADVIEPMAVDVPIEVIQPENSLQKISDSGNLPAESRETADILIFFDDLFDSVNGSFHKVIGGKIYRAALTPTSPHHKLWQDNRGNTWTIGERMELQNISIKGNRHPKLSFNVVYDTNDLSKTKSIIINEEIKIYIVYKIIQLVNGGTRSEISMGIFKWIPSKIFVSMSYLIRLSSEELKLEDKNLFMYEGNEVVIYRYSKMINSFKLAVSIETVDNVSYTNCFKQLNDATELTDFELKGDDGSVRVHKAVLAAASPVMKQMLAGTWRETTEGKLDMRVSTATLQHFRDYIYLETLPKTGLAELLVLAQCYMMPQLERLCIFKLFDNLPVRKEVNDEGAEKPNLEEE